MRVGGVGGVGVVFGGGGEVAAEGGVAGGGGGEEGVEGAEVGHVGSIVVGAWVGSGGDDGVSVVGVKMGSSLVECDVLF